MAASLNGHVGVVQPLVHQLHTSTSSILLPSALVWGSYLISTLMMCVLTYVPVTLRNVWRCDSGIVRCHDYRLRNCEVHVVNISVELMN